MGDGDGDERGQASSIHYDLGVLLPKGSKPSFLLLTEAIEGRKLAEGDQPVTFPIAQDDMAKHAHHWSKMRAVAIDSAGMKYKSKAVSDRPSWAKS